MKISDTIKSQFHSIDAEAKAAYESSRSALDLVEERIKVALSSEAEKLSAISEYLLNLGGKRIRPMLMVLSARTFGMATPTSALIDAAAGIELIHMATLLHDDIIDRSEMRRHKQSAFLRYGLPSTLLAGDFLLVRAFGIAAQLDRYLLSQTEKACIALTEGEEIEGIISKDHQPSFESYLNVIDKKTASLFYLSCLIGAQFAGAKDAVFERYAEFGRNVGISFQMIDDILDITATDEILGKPAGTDLKQKTPSLINILWLESKDPKAVEYFSIEEPTFDQAKTAQKYLLSSSIIDQARSIAKKYASNATSILEELKESIVDHKTAQQLNAIVNFTLERCM